jgi:hypothetical protein
VPHGFVNGDRLLRFQGDEPVERGIGQRTALFEGLLQH